MENAICNVIRKPVLSPVLLHYPTEGAAGTRLSQEKKIPESKAILGNIMKSNQNAVYPSPSRRCLLRWGLWACEGRGCGPPGPLLPCPRASLSPSRVPAVWKRVLLHSDGLLRVLTDLHARTEDSPARLPVCPGLPGSGSLWGGRVGWAGPLGGHELGEVGVGGAHRPRAPWQLAHVDPLPGVFMVHTRSETALPTQ